MSSLTDNVIALLKAQPLLPEELAKEMGDRNVTVAYSAIKRLRKSHIIHMIHGRYTYIGPLETPLKAAHKTQKPPKTPLKPPLRKAGTLPEKVLQWIREGSKTRKELIRLLDGRDPSYIIKRLIKKGHPMQILDGKYTLNEEPPKLPKEQEPEPKKGPKPKKSPEPKQESKQVEPDDDLFVIRHERVSEAMRFFGKDKMQELVSTIERYNNAYSKLCKNVRELQELL